MLTKIMYTNGRLLIIACVLVACTSDSQLMAFSSEGCASFLDRDLNGPGDWCDCCLEHDIAYWRGGSSEQRDQADNRLRECVKQKTNNEALAEDMYQGVRSGDSPYFFTGYRWGYGWGAPRKHQSLNEIEVDVANQLLIDYFKSGNQVCL